jgi:glutamyl-tRNA synthetase
MPQWAHLPLILKPDGNGKLSKRDGDRLGFPVFAMDWTDPRTNEQTTGFKERGFLPEAFINMLAMLGWNSGSEQELFSLEELVNFFSLERVHKGGAKFDYEKAKWFNHEWIKKVDVDELRKMVEKLFAENNITTDDVEILDKVIALTKDRCTFINDFVQQAGYFFNAPETIDIAAIQPKWDEKKKAFFDALIQLWNDNFKTEATALEQQFKTLAETQQIKAGELMLPFRIMLVGGKFGPAVFDIAQVIGKTDTIQRIERVMNELN